VEKIVLDEYENIKANGVTEDEVKRAKAQLRTDILFTRDGAFSVASALNEAIARGDWKSYTTILANIDNVTPEMVQQVTKKYLQGITLRFKTHYVQRTKVLLVTSFQRMTRTNKQSRKYHNWNLCQLLQALQSLKVTTLPC
jgi:predicted Zn-dependent peptidase